MQYIKHNEFIHCVTALRALQCSENPPGPKAPCDFLLTSAPLPSGCAATATQLAHHTHILRLGIVRFSAELFASSELRALRCSENRPGPVAPCDIIRTSAPSPSSLLQPSCLITHMFLFWE